MINLSKSHRSRSNLPEGKKPPEEEIPRVHPNTTHVFMVTPFRIPL